MAVTFQFVNAIICEKVLTEADGIPSIIRIVDIFFVPEGAPENAVIQFYLWVGIKTVPVPVNEQVHLGFTLVRSNGERVRLPEPPGPLQLGIYDNDPSIPGGFGFAIQINIMPKNMGTCFIEVDIDGELITRVPFTLRRPPQLVKQN